MIDLTDAYLDTAGQAFHPGRDTTATLEVAVDAVGIPCRRITEADRWEVVAGAAHIQGDNPIEIHFRAQPRTHHRLSERTPILVRSGDLRAPADVCDRCGRVRLSSRDLVAGPLLGTAMVMAASFLAPEDPQTGELVYLVPAITVPLTLVGCIVVIACALVALWRAVVALSRTEPPR